ncbi:MAG: hypothetical protein ACPGVH_02195 [Chitinophagales bacterium]
MRNLLIIGILLISMVSCNKLDKLTQFNIDYKETVTVPGNTIISLPFDLDDQELETNSSTSFENNNSNKDLVEKATLTKMQLDHKSPSSGDLSFIESISIFLEADGLPEIKIAWKDVVPENVGKTLDLDLTDADLKDYVKKDDLRIRINSVIDEALSQDQVIDINTSIFIDAKILGL